MGKGKVFGLWVALAVALFAVAGFLGHAQGHVAEGDALQATTACQTAIKGANGRLSFDGAPDSIVRLKDGKYRVNLVANEGPKRAGFYCEVEDLGSDWRATYTRLN